MSALGQKQPLKTVWILASECPVLGKSRHSPLNRVAAFGRSGQFQSGQFNEYGRLLSANTGRSVALARLSAFGQKRSFRIHFVNGNPEDVTNLLVRDYN